MPEPPRPDLTTLAAAARRELIVRASTDGVLHLELAAVVIISRYIAASDDVLAAVTRAAVGAIEEALDAHYMCRLEELARQVARDASS